MATVLTPQADVWQGLQAINWTAADMVAGTSFANDGRKILLVQNTDSVTRGVTITAVADEAGRAVNNTLNLAAGGCAIVSYLQPSWWNQTSGAEVGRVILSAGSALVRFAVIEAPANVLVRTV